ncbi:polysaccharide deacetylase family protein [Herminiimonas sp. CN]|uniref:polysaccharide deacetylase family protein n=1 Tax=Herminiimonas sp. CN TaxID=1349818 RepID=UPI0012DF8EE6|nr:polysaccharide deacetylase family protein [Herminiimonas sp. CN]
MMHNNSLRWRPTALVSLTILLHVALLATLVAAPLAVAHAWRWVLAIILANHFLITLVGLWPRSTWLGPNWIRLPPASAAQGEIALTIDDGPDPDVTPQVLEMLDRYGVKASFFCIGDNAARYPDMCRNIVERGHTLENHSQRHRHNFSLLGLRGLRREIQAGQNTLSAITGCAPLFFRAPAGLRNIFLAPVLAGLGLHLATWSRRGFDTNTADTALVCRRLTQNLKAGDILLLHDGNCAQTSAGVPVIIAVLPLLCEAAAKAGLRFVTLPDALQSGCRD